MGDKFIDGLDDFMNEVNGFVDKANKLSGKRTVSYDELFPPSFMAKYTKSKTIEEFLDDLGVHSNSELASLPQQTIEDKVVSETSFSSWHDMGQQATNEYYGHKLGF